LLSDWDLTCFYAYRFCGKISSVDYNSSAHTATIHFEKEQAAKTALMLNGGTLDGATIHVGSDAVSEEHAHDQPRTSLEGDHIEQHDKPRAGIVAEMLAKGYALSESILHKAIDVDKKQVCTIEFLSFDQNVLTTGKIGNFYSLPKLYSRSRCHNRRKDRWPRSHR
jgi:hypothetical protein